MEGHEGDNGPPDRRTVAVVAKQSLLSSDSWPDLRQGRVGSTSDCGRDRAGHNCGIRARWRRAEGVPRRA